MQKDRDLFQQFLTRSTAEESQQLKDAEDAAGTDFFPVSASGANAPLGTYATLLWNGKQIDLTDVPRAAWFAPYVQGMVKMGIMAGYADASGQPIGLFRPAQPVSIEEIAKVVLVSAGIDPSSCGAGQPKNPAALGRWSAPYVLCAESRHLSVFSDGSVDLSRPALRGEVVTTILEAFSVAPAAVLPTSPFTDVLPTTRFANAILRASTDGIIGGYRDADGNATGLFGPDRTIMRGELAKVLSLALQVYGGKI
jgi:hypothetical protein